MKLWSFRGAVRLLLLSLALIYFGSATKASTVTLAWDPNPEPDVVLYHVYYGIVDTSPPLDFLVSEPVATLEALLPGATYFFYVTAVNSLGLESEPSEQIIYTVPGSSGPVNQAPIVFAGSDQVIVLPSAATLSGAAVDDGLPIPPGAVTVLWSKVSGPGTVAFGNPAAATTTATFSSAGTYVLRLTADDGELAASDEVTIVVKSPVNQPPSVFAGPDQVIVLPSQAILTGTVEDDGLPNPPGAVTVLWTKVSGPGAVAFSNPAAATTMASFASAGTYILRLTADDGELAAGDDVTIVVQPPVNQPPAVFAGPDQSLILPSATTLVGAVEDDGLPNPPGAVTVFWSKISGPGTVVFGDATSVVTTAGFTSAGTYVLRLTANDGELGASDDVTITVLPADTHPPVAESQEVATVRNTSVAITLTGHDSDDLPLIFSVLTPPQNGTLHGSAPDLIYTPRGGFVGLDSFSFTVGNGTLNSAPAQVRIEVTQKEGGSPPKKGDSVDPGDDPFDDPLREGMPFVSPIYDQVAPMNTATQPLVFEVSGDETVYGEMTLSAQSSNPSLVPDQNIILEGEGSERTLAIVPAANQTGTATITVTFGNAEASDERTFTVFVYNSAEAGMTVPTLLHRGAIFGLQCLETLEGTQCFLLRSSGESGQVYAVEHSADLKNWTAVPSAFVEVDPGSYASRVFVEHGNSVFFRIRWLGAKE